MTYTIYHLRKMLPGSMWKQMAAAVARHIGKCKLLGLCK